MAGLGLTNAEWPMIARLLPNEPCGVAQIDGWRMLKSIFSVSRTGLLWRDLRERYRPDVTIYNHYNRWAKKRV